MLLKNTFPKAPNQAFLNRMLRVKTLSLSEKKKPEVTAEEITINK